MKSIFLGITNLALIRANERGKRTNRFKGQLPRRETFRLVISAVLPFHSE